MAWTLGVASIVLIPLKLVGWLRVSAVKEESGLDAYYHGGDAYNLDQLSCSPKVDVEKHTKVNTQGETNEAADEA